MASHGTSWRTGSPDPERDRQQLMLEFASRAAHEIIGPVDQVSSLTALFVQKFRGRLGDDADGLLSHIETARDRLAITSMALRKYFQVGMAEYRRSAVDMNAVLQAALASLQKQVADSGAEIRADELPSVEGDRDLLFLLFQNILENSLKFRREGAPPHVVVSLAASTPNPVFQVKDDGIGIPPQYHEQVFDCFKKLNGHAYPGSGLGLTMARLITDLHHGRIWLEPATEGTRVCFELPATSSAR